MADSIPGSMQSTGMTCKSCLLLCQLVILDLFRPWLDNTGIMEIMSSKILRTNELHLGTLST